MIWQPIASEPLDETKRLVTEDPADPELAHLVTRMGDGKHFDGDVILEDTGYELTHWHPVPR